MSEPPDDFQEKSRAASRFLEETLPAKIFAGPNEFLENCRRSAEGSVNQAGFLAALLGADAFVTDAFYDPFEVRLSFPTVDDGPAVEFQVTWYGGAAAAILILPGGASGLPPRAVDARYLLVYATRHVAGAVLEIKADGSSRRLACAATTETLRTSLGPGHSVGSRVPSRSPLVAVCFALDSVPSFGTTCIGCGARCDAFATMVRPVVRGEDVREEELRQVGVPWCRRCQWKMAGKVFMLILGAATSAGVGCLFLASGLGWWPTWRRAQVLLLGVLALPGLLVALWMWGDPDVPVAVRQRRHSFVVSFKRANISNQFVERNRYLFE